MTRHALLLSCAGLVALGGAAGPVSAQREIVQPLPGPGSAQLGDALSRLARDPTNLDALLDAGDAALQVEDIDAAIGFFGRAKDLSPDNPRIKVGLARAYTRSRRPIEALRLFAEAEAAGIPNAQMAEDRGLAFDLVGDSASAQQLYRLAIAGGAGPELTRRLALSLAISRNREGMETTLLPLLEAGDVSAFRTRAFGLAILGDEEAAQDIADTMLPAGMGKRMEPYLRYMPRLTQAQQAAAGNLGIFPRTASIGTDDARIAAYSSQATQFAGASTPSPAIVPQRTGQASPPPPPPSQAPSPPPSQAPASSSSSSNSPAADAPSRTTTAQAAQPRQPSARIIGAENLLPGRRLAPRTTREGGAPARSTSGPVQSSPASSQPPAASMAAPTRSAPVTASQEPAVVVANQTSYTAAAPSELPPVSATAPQSAPVPEVTLEEAFSGFSLEPATTRAAPGAVDITAIDIPREREEPKPPPPPAHPARHWVQIATGKDRAALRFDWRRIARSSDGKIDGKGPFVTPWGEANRLLAGPYETAAKARDMVNELKAIGVDSFPFSSAEGEEISSLP